MGEKRNAYRLLVGKPEGKKPLGRPRCGWVDNIRMDLGEVGWGDVDCSGLALKRNRWRAPVNSVLNLWVPCNPGKLLSGLTTVGLSNNAQLQRVSYFVYLVSISSDITNDMEIYSYGILLLVRFFNLILFVICTSTFSKLCKNMYTCIQWNVEECSLALLCN
jgi:hypothetical protein